MALLKGSITKAELDFGNGQRGPGLDHVALRLNASLY